MRSRLHARKSSHTSRRGAATLDYVLILGTLIPLCGIALTLGEKIIRLAYETIAVMVSGPFL
jgi:hypothetical protein